MIVAMTITSTTKTAFMTAMGRRAAIGLTARMNILHTIGRAVTLPEAQVVVAPAEAVVNPATTTHSNATAAPMTLRTRMATTA